MGSSLTQHTCVHPVTLCTTPGFHHGGPAQGYPSPCLRLTRPCSLRPQHFRARTFFTTPLLVPAGRCCARARKFFLSPNFFRTASMMKYFKSSKVLTNFHIDNIDILTSKWPFGVVYRSGLSTIWDYLPVEVVYRSWLSTVQGYLPFGTTYHSRLSTVQGCLPFGAVFQ